MYGNRTRSASVTGRCRTIWPTHHLWTLRELNPSSSLQKRRAAVTPKALRNLDIYCVHSMARRLHKQLLQYFVPNYGIEPYLAPYERAVLYHYTKLDWSRWLVLPQFSYGPKPYMLLLHYTLFRGGMMGNAPTIDWFTASRLAFCLQTTLTYRIAKYCSLPTIWT